MPGGLSEKLSKKKKVMSWKEKIGQPDQKPAKKESSETPSRKRQRSDEVILDLF